MTVKPIKDAQLDPDGTKLLAKMKDLASKASSANYIVQVRLTPKDKPPTMCSCCCSGG